MQPEGSGRESGGLKNALTTLAVVLGVVVSTLAILQSLRDLVEREAGAGIPWLAGLAAVLLVLTGLYLVVAKRQVGTGLPDARDERAVRREPRYPRGRKFGAVLLCFVGLSLLATAVKTVVRLVRPPSHAVILVARFDGPDRKDELKIEDKLLVGIKDAIEPDSGKVLQVGALPRVISEEDGSDMAKAMGTRHKAAIVIWGSYTTVASVVGLVVHFEVLTPAPEVTLPGAGGSHIDRPIPLAEFASVSLPVSGGILSDIEFSCLTTIGMSYYACKKWPQAISSLRVASAAAVGKPDSVRSALLLYLGNAYQATQKPESAYNVYSEAVQLDSSNAPALNNLGLLYHAQARYAEAESLFKQALEIREAKLGKEHPDVATSLDNLASLYKTTARYAEAESLFKRALQIREAKLGKEHPDVATSLDNLASLYKATARYADAEPLLKRALGIRQKTLGPEHPDVAAAQNDLASLYQATARYADAEPLYRWALGILEKTLGPKHPYVAIGLSNLASLYYDMGRHAEAEPLFNRALEIDEKALGREHPDVATCLNNLALLDYATSRYADAEPLFNRALEIREMKLGLEHPDVAQSLNNLAELYKAKGRYSDAEPLLNRALEIREMKLGLEHPDVAQSLNNLAELYRAMGKLAEAETLFKRTLEIDEKALGKHHPGTAIDLNNLAELYCATDRYADAEPLYKRALEICEAKLGKEHPTTRTVQTNLGILQRKLRGTH